MLKTIFLLTIMFWLSACLHKNSPSTPPIDPCLSNPDHIDCSLDSSAGDDDLFVGSNLEEISTSTAENVFNKDNATRILSNTLHNILNLSQIVIFTAIKGHEYQSTIKSIPDQSQSQNLMPKFFTASCDNAPASYTLSFQYYGAKYTLSGTTMTINFGGKGNGADIDPDVYCQIGNLRLSGILDITAFAFNPNDLSKPNDWKFSSEAWPTLILHEDTYLTTINNPIAITAHFNSETGLSVNATALKNDYITEENNKYIHGIVFNHYTAGSDPNNPAETNIDIFRTDFNLLALMDTANITSATQFSIHANGLIFSNLTGSDINMQINSPDSGTTAALTWTDNSIADAPKNLAPGSGRITIKAIDSENRIVAGVSPSTAAAMDLVIHTINPEETKSFTILWSALMSQH